MWARVTTAASSGSCVGCGDQVARAVPCACELRRGRWCVVAMLAATALRARAGRYAELCVCVRGLPPLECCEGDVHDLNAPSSLPPDLCRDAKEVPF